MADSRRSVPPVSFPLLFPALVPVVLFLLVAGGLGFLVRDGVLLGDVVDLLNPLELAGLWL